VSDASYFLIIRCCQNRMISPKIWITLKILLQGCRSPPFSQLLSLLHLFLHEGTHLCIKVTLCSHAFGLRRQYESALHMGQGRTSPYPCTITRPTRPHHPVHLSCTRATPNQSRLWTSLSACCREASRDSRSWDVEGSVFYTSP